ncbi:MAG: FkbM family methyltransferase [Lachnospiraceae bacterium]|nr:FkbM family methyltransferase [Lachnospiraceae bacterium]
MYYRKFISTINSFTEKLQDEESINIYNAKFKYYFDRDEVALEESLFDYAIKYKDSFSCYGLSLLYNRHPEMVDSPFIILGAGLFGKETIRTLSILGKEIKGYIDDDPEYPNGRIDGYPLIEVKDITEKYDDCIVIIATKRIYQLERYYKLLNNGVKDTNIFMYTEGGLYFDYGNQYFDVDDVKPDKEGEIFVDGGCYNGGSSIQAYKWAAGNLKKVYAFEPDPNSYNRCKETLSKIGCEYELIPCATWSEKTKLSFDVNVSAGFGSKVKSEGTSLVDAISIDEVLDGNKATYIKLDVEGSELETLKGVVKTIKTWRPKLAISIYHKPEDIIEIPAFLEGLDMDYKYYIRQYQTRKCETTLYAI